MPDKYISAEALTLSLRDDPDLNAASFARVKRHIEAAPDMVKRGRWVLTANEQSNYRWNVTAECSKCHLEKGEIWAAFFPGFPNELAKDIALASAEEVLDNYCPHCGADMRGVEDG